LLLVSGSPRAGGNTDTLLGEVAAGFEAAGGASDYLYLRDHKIGYCQGCLACTKQLPRPCVQKDEMDVLYDRILNAQALVLGTPIYFWGPSAQMKTFLDRWFPFGDWQKTTWVKALQGKPTGLVMVYAEEEPLVSGVDLTYRQLHIVVTCTGGRVIGTVHGTGEHPGDVLKRPELLSAACNLGGMLYARTILD